MLLQLEQPPLPMGLFIVADGVGGQAQGDEASALAVRLAARHIIDQVYLPLLGDDEAAERAPINEVLQASMQIAHQAIMRRLPKAGTTMTLALILGESVFVVHAGDSRAYLGERGHLHLLTRDHSMAARFEEMGGSTSEDAALQRNILYKALGQGAQIQPDILYRDLGPGHYLMLCCDGLWDNVSTNEMIVIIEAAATPGAACQELIARALENGAEDNITVILAARGWPLPLCG
jgi:serine/threonine protein phosphatase PrpC